MSTYLLTCASALRPLFSCKAFIGSSVRMPLVACAQRSDAVHW